MIGEIDIINLYRYMMNVNRLSGRHIQRNYNIALHSYYVGLLFMHFAEIENIEFDVEVLNIVFKHDVLESITNDLPWPVKNLNEKTKKNWEEIEEEVIKANPILKNYSDEIIKMTLNKDQFNLFKACDYLELWIFVGEEISLGNCTNDIVIIFDRSRELIREFRFKSIMDFIQSYNVN